MQHRVLSFSVAMVLGLAPVFADTTAVTPANGLSTSNSFQVTPSNAQYVSPTTNQNASTANVSTQINNQNIGANSYGQGITCQAPQVALGGFGARQSSGVGTPNSDAGFSVQYLAPVGQQSTRSCQALANEVLHQRTLDTQLTFIQKCADFARAGIELDPRIYPELARQCAGVRVAPVNTGAVPVTGYPRVNGAYVPAVRQAALLKPARPHVSDFSPKRNPLLQRLALHRVVRIAALRREAARRMTRTQRREVAARLRHENQHLRAVIEEYRLEVAFLHRIKADSAWRRESAATAPNDHVLSYNQRAAVEPAAPESP